MLSFFVGLSGTNDLNLIPLISLDVKHEQNSESVPELNSNMPSASNVKTLKPYGSYILR